MAQVPYNPTPDVAPQDNATPYLHVDTPEAAFGGNVGRALSQLGQTSDQVGNEIFARANAMQQLNNETEARNADTQYMITAGQLHANFSSLQGNAAGPEAFTKYTQDLQDARDKLRQGLTNPSSQKLYDASSLSTMGRTIFNGAGHSAEQLKQASIGAAGSQVQAATDATLGNPNSEADFQAGLQKGANAVRAQGNLRGLTEEQIQQNIVDNTSNMTLSRIQGFVNQGKPEVAQSLLQKALADGSIRGQNIGAVTSMVEKGLYNTGAKNVANGIETGANIALGKGQVPIAQAANAIGMHESGNTYDRLGPVITQGQYSGEQALGKYQVMPGNLPSWLKDAGMPAMSAQQFLNNPQAQDQLFASKFGKLMQQTGNFNDAASIWHSGVPLAQAIASNRRDVNQTTQQYVADVNGQLAKTASLSDKVAAARTEAGNIAPNLPLMADYAQQHVISQANQDAAIQRNDYLTNKNAFDTALTGVNGTVPASLDQLPPDAKAAYDKMTPVQQLAAQSSLRTAQAQDNVSTPSRQANAAAMRGLSGTDPTSFAEQDFHKLDLTAMDRKNLVQLQGKMLKGGTEDPRVAQGMSILAPSLQAAGITVRDDKDSFNQFRGNLADEISDFQKEKNRAPNREEIQKIGAQLLQDQVTSHWYGESKEPMFRQVPPEAERAKILDAFGAKGFTPTEQQIQAAYTRQRFQELYGAKPTSGKTAMTPPRG